MGYGRVKLV